MEYKSRESEIRWLSNSDPRTTVLGSVVEVPGIKLLDEASAWILAPLAGVRLASSLQIGGRHISLISFFNWRLLERKELIDEYEVPISSGNIEIPFIILPIVEFTNADSIISGHALEIDGLTLALRLAGCDGFIEPSLSCIYFRNGALRGDITQALQDESLEAKQNDFPPGLNVRWPGPYRSEMYEIHKHPEELQPLLSAEADRAAILLPAVQKWLQRSDEQGAVCATLYRQSFQPALKAGEQLLSLFAAIETLMFGWREEIAGTTLAKRLDVLRSLDPRCSRLDIGELRAARNRIAHGVPDVSQYLRLLPSVRALVASLLRAWIEFNDVNPNFDRFELNEIIAEVSRTEEKDFADTLRHKLESRNLQLVLASAIASSCGEMELLVCRA